MRKKLFLLAMIAALFLPILSIHVNAASGSDKTYEVVMLIDVSGSMMQADPNKVSIEAALRFANNVPSTAESCKISVVLYNSDVIRALERVDVTRGSEKAKYSQNLEIIKNLGKNGKYNEFICWAKDTDIGAAIVEAKDILSSSSAAKKAVLLFTDGKIDLDNRPSVDSPEEILSETNSYESAEYFKSVGVPMYTIGLNKNNSVDKQYLQKLADMTDGKFWSCTSLDDLNDLFTYFTTEFFSVKFQGSEDYPVSPDVITEETFNIYGQAIYEANFNLFCLAKIKTYQVISPEGTVVAERKEDGTETVFEGCVVDSNENKVDIKLLDPTDGEWTLRFSSKERGTLQLGRIYFYDLGIEDGLGSQVVVGETVELSPKLFNIEGNFAVTTKAIYEEARCRVTVSYNGSERQYTAQVNSQGNGYSIELPFSKPGEYQITYQINHDQFDVTATKTVNATTPKLALTTDSQSVGMGEAVKVTGKFVHPINGQTMPIPEYLDGFDLEIAVSMDGKEIAKEKADYSENGNEFSFLYTPEKAGQYTVTATVSRYNTEIQAGAPVAFAVWKPQVGLSVEKKEFNIADGKASAQLQFLDAAGKPLTEYPQYMKDYTVVFTVNGKASDAISLSDFAANGSAYSFKPTKAGEYTVSVVVEGNNDRMEASIQFKVKASAITMEEDSLPDIEETIIGGSVQKEIDLEEIFTDSDGDELTFVAESDSDDILVDVDDGMLILTIQSGAVGSVTITVSDGRGATYTASMDVKVNSLLPLIIGIIVAILLIGISIPLILLYLKKRRIIRMKYRIKVSVNNEFAVYDISRASNNRRAKPMMTLKEVLTIPSLASYSQGDLPESDAEDVIRTHGGKISITGYAFKDGIRILLPGGKEKVFQKYVVTVPVKNDSEEDTTEISFAFGKTTDFREEDEY